MLRLTTPVRPRTPSQLGFRLLEAVGGLLLLASGCGGTSGPELANVTGTVTLDDKPLADAAVVFAPEAQGDEQVRPALGRTDQNGKYSLGYSSSRSGARPGKYKVSISTYQETSEDKDGNETPGVPERVPDVYSSKSTLTAEVTLDGRPINFDLKSDAGKVVQPKPAQEADE